MIKPYFTSTDKRFFLLHGNSMELLSQFDFKFDMVFADPPYFLSNDGLSIQSGKIVSVNKGKWDKSKGIEHVNNFNRQWLKAIRERMKDDATIWISGTMHNIFSIGQLLTELDFKILNIVTWQKTNPPPNFSCRYFTHSTEQIIWARKHKKVPHYFNYDLMKKLNNNKQMKDVWTFPAIAPWEKSCGKHPTQKPLSVLTRTILASTKQNAWILDPFTGSSTTGIAANLANRRFVGIDQEKGFLDISINRKKEIDIPKVAASYRSKIKGFSYKQEYQKLLFEEPKIEAKVLIAYSRKSDLKKLMNTNKFYFHAMDKGKSIKGLPSEYLTPKMIYVYNGGRGKPFKLSGYYGVIKAITLKHKLEIEEKINSKTEFYYEVILNTNFVFNEKLTGVKIQDLSLENFEKSKERLKKYLPILISKVNL